MIQIGGQGFRDAAFDRHLEWSLLQGGMTLPQRAKHFSSVRADG